MGTEDEFELERNPVKIIVPSRQTKHPGSKKKYNFAKVKARRKMEKNSQKINRKK